MVEGWHPGRKDSDTLITVLEPHFEEEEWREVIPLAAALGGKATDALVQRLSEIVSVLNKAQEAWHFGENLALLALINCLADEAAARPETIRAAIREIIRLGRVLLELPSTKLLTGGRYGGTLREEARKELMDRTQNFFNLSFALRYAVGGKQ